MRVVNFKAEDGPRLGARIGNEIIDLSVAAPQLPRKLNEFVGGGTPVLEAAKSAIKVAPRTAHRALDNLHFLPPNLSPSKIICLGVNYLAHAAEGGLGQPEFPPLFLRGPSSLIGHKEPMIRPTVSEQLDYEVELAVIIGKTARHVRKADALSYVAGYSAFNDGSVRDYQLRTSQWTLGKNFDGTGAIGPELVTPDELPEGASGLRVQTRLNGKSMQDSNTAKMIFGVAETIALLTECLTLVPGDIIIMGTCEGVGLVRKPPIFMKPGDVCEIEIEGIGVLTNPIVQEQW